MRTTPLLVSSLVAVVLSLGATEAYAVCGDVTADGHVSASDALAVLQAATGMHDGMMCDPCDGTTTTMDDSTTTTTVGGGAASYNLHVEKSGTYSGQWMHMRGSGRVTSEPAGIDCGNDCNQVFDAGQDVTLTAVANQDSIFVGWSGDVPEECRYNDYSCTVKVTHDLTVRAIFMWDMM